MTQPIIPIRGSSQDFTEIEEITSDIVMFTSGSCALVMTTSAVNFGLLSQNEQDAIVYAYAGLLNSLSFPVEFLIQTQHKDVSAYLQLLDEREKEQKNPKLAKSIHNYRLFVAATVKEKEVLDKKFYLTVPFSYLELGTAAGFILGTKKHHLPYPKSYIVERALTALIPKKDHLVRLLGRVGLRAYQLNNDQLIALFFGLYNPGSPLPERK